MKFQIFVNDGSGFIPVDYLPVFDTRIDAHVYAVEFFDGDTEGFFRIVEVN